MTSLADSDHLIDDILPSREVHLIGGPSGAGKTTLLYQLIIEPLRKGLPVFGKPSHTIPICYCACDRSQASIKRTLKRVGIDDPVPYFSIQKVKHVRTLLSVINEARKACPGCKLLIIDAFGMLVPDGDINDYKAVADFLADASALCEQYDITIIGIVHAPKSKEGERYLNPRQRIMGTVAWAGFCETVILIEPTEEGDDRIVQILPRNAEDLTFNFAFDGGVLKETTPDGLVYDQLDTHLLPHLKPDIHYTRLELMELIGQLGIKCSLASFKRWLKAKIEDGQMEKVKYGTYKTRPKQ